jgi:hypothetical protein
MVAAADDGGNSMKGTILGAAIALALVGIGLFWWQGRAQVERGAPPPSAEVLAKLPPDALPDADVSGLRGPVPPEASELTREQQRFMRYDRNRDWRITRNEMLSTRTEGFRKLDVDGNNLLTFEEWAVTTVERFEGMDKDRNDKLTPAEFATSKPAPAKKPACRC